MPGEWDCDVNEYANENAYESARRVLGKCWEWTNAMPMTSANDFPWENAGNGSNVGLMRGRMGAE